jgi:predicted RNase H-like HicB family nuclease
MTGEVESGIKYVKRTLVAKHPNFTRRRENAMQYTLILTEKTEGGIQLTVPALPACTVEAPTRDEAIRLAREAIAQTVIRSEIVQIDIPQQPRATAQPRGVPWEWFGEAKADPTWDGLFDDLERRREATRDVE